MTGLLAQCNILGSICHIDAYGNRTDEEKELLAKGGLFAPIDFALQFLISQAIVSTRKYGQTHNPPVEFEELALLFDEPSNKATEQRFLGILSHPRAKHPHWRMLTGITFEESHSKSPLQAADMLAYTTCHWHLKQAFPDEADFDFPIIPGSMRLIENVAAEGGVYNERAMLNLILQERVNRINKDLDPPFY